MIKLMKNLLNPNVSTLKTPKKGKVSFALTNKTEKIGVLSFDNGKWIFKYDKDSKDTIIDFPNKDRIYESEDLWPFFNIRIPTINQPYQKKKIAKLNIQEDDSLALLKLFGKKTIANPYQLMEE